MLRFDPPPGRPAALAFREVMAGYVEAPEDAPDAMRPEHLKSGAAQLRQEDELRRDRQLHGKPVEAPSSPPTVTRTGYGAK